jgi:hypothetical protein
MIPIHANKKIHLYSNHFQRSSIRSSTHLITDTSVSIPIAPISKTRSTVRRIDRISLIGECAYDARVIAAFGEDSLSLANIPETHFLASTGQHLPPSPPVSPGFNRFHYLALHSLLSLATSWTTSSKSWIRRVSGPLSPDPLLHHDYGYHSTVQRCPKSTTRGNPDRAFHETQGPNLPIMPVISLL